MNPTTETSPNKPVDKLAYTLAELTAALGIHKSTVWSLEKKGLLRPVPGIRHKLYAKTEVTRFLSGQTHGDRK